MSAPDSHPSPESRPYDEAVEALRHRVNELPRYSFWVGERGGVTKVADPHGRWIEWDAMHQLFDPDVVDAAIAKLNARAAIKKAGERA